MLSYENIIKEMGKNLFVYPLDDVKIHGNSIDLTASEFAWTTDGEYIFDEKENKIVVPPHKTACVLTQEAIYVTSKIGGTYHSRVGLSKRGFGHIGTMLDPEYHGQSLILLHNTTNDTLSIDHRERIVSIVFHYLNMPILTLSHNSSPGHREKLAGFKNFSKYVTWCDENPWASEKRKLVNTVLKDVKYKELKKEYQADQRQWGTFWNKIKLGLRDRVIQVALLTLAFIIVDVIVFGIFSAIDGFSTAIVAELVFLFGLLVSNLGGDK